MNVKGKRYLILLMFLLCLNLLLASLTISWWSYKTDQLELTMRYLRQDGKPTPINFFYVENIDNYFTVILSVQLLFPTLIIFLLINKYFKGIGGYKNYAKVFFCSLILILVGAMAGPGLKLFFLYLI